MADAALPGDGHPQAGGDDGRALPGRAAPLGGQLRPPLRVHRRIPPLLRAAAVRHPGRGVRQGEEGEDDMQAMICSKVELEFFFFSVSVFCIKSRIK